MGSQNLKKNLFFTLPDYFLLLSLNLKNYWNLARNCLYQENSRFTQTFICILTFLFACSPSVFYDVCSPNVTGFDSRDPNKCLRYFVGTFNC